MKIRFMFTCLACNIRANVFTCFACNIRANVFTCFACNIRANVFTCFACNIRANVFTCFACNIRVSILLRVCHVTVYIFLLCWSACFVIFIPPFADLIVNHFS